MHQGPVDPFKGFLRGDPTKGADEAAAPDARFADPARLVREPLAKWVAGSPRLFLGLVGGEVTGPPGKFRHILGGQAIGIEDDRHVCTFAGSRAGKGRSAIIPNMLHWPGWVLATDPKGELAAITARQRKRLWPAHSLAFTKNLIIRDGLKACGPSGGACRHRAAALLCVAKEAMPCRNAFIPC